jgi:hypothetical protein
MKPATTFKTPKTTMPKTSSKTKNPPTDDMASL